MLSEIFTHRAIRTIGNILFFLLILVLMVDPGNAILHLKDKIFVCFVGYNILFLKVFISTSITPKFMGIRAERILEEFPEIPAEHIYMGSRKDKINVDILFDDGMHNVFRSNAAYPILMRRPWNQNATGMLAVNTYDEFLKLVEVIPSSSIYAIILAGDALSVK